jgi:hypothetical protein
MYSKYSAVFILVCASVINAQDIAPGREIEITFPDSVMPPTLYTIMTGTPSVPRLIFRLPDDYERNRNFPLLLYVPGFHGGPKGNLGNAKKIAGSDGWIAATITLFKAAVDTSEPSSGIMVSMNDFSVISKAFSVMLGKLYELVPNIDTSKSTMVGFSNGAVTIAVLVSNQDKFILSHFKNFCIVDQGMFHLTDLHKKPARDCRYYVLAGDKGGYGRDLIVRRTMLLQDEWKLLGVNVKCEIMKNTGHEFSEAQMNIVGKWLKNEVMQDLSKK